jgi:succinate dehydrogenase/fumarate reductase cytochrome b subunit
MRIAIAALGVFVALAGIVFTLQGFGVIVSDSPMTNTTTWSVLGPLIALVGFALLIGAWRRKS